MKRKSVNPWLAMLFMALFIIIAGFTSPEPPNTLLGPLQMPAGQQPDRRFGETSYFGRSQTLITLHPWTITNTNCTPAVDSYLGRPCATFAGAGAATDGTNFCFGAASILMTSGKTYREQFSYASEDIANHEMACGFGVVGTGMIASDPTNFVMLRWTTGQTAPHLRFRKASGTAQDIVLDITRVETTGALQTGVWYDFEFRVTPAAVAGTGRIEVWMGRAGATKVQLYNSTFGSQIPDTVKLAPFAAGRAGGSVTTAWHWGELTYEVSS